MSTARTPLAERKAAVYVGQAGIVLLAVLLWEWAVTAGWIEGGLAGQPSRIFALFIDAVTSGELFPHLDATLYEEFLGFAMSRRRGRNRRSLGLVVVTLPVPRCSSLSR